MDTVHKHLEQHPNATARLSFADFSSAFNTLQPHILAEKLSTCFHLDDQLILWIIDFLTNRSQRVLVNNTFSNLTFTSTGYPRAASSHLCSLSSILIIIYYYTKIIGLPVSLLSSVCKQLMLLCCQCLSGSPQDAGFAALAAELRGGEQLLFPGLFSSSTPDHPCHPCS